MEDRHGINIWLAYSDLFAGMLIVFAAFYGLQHMQLAKERALNEDLQKAQNKAVTLLDRVASKINERYNDPNKKVKTDGTQLTLPGDVTFESREFNIRPESEGWLLEIGGELQKAINDLGEDSHSILIEIRGHTDAHQMGGWEPMPTNWELSSRRATEIVKLFQRNNLLDAKKFRVVAVGAGEFEEYDKNFRTDGSLKNSDELEDLRKIQIRIIPNYEDLLRRLSTKSPF
jgi:chemotaxis protein MotB